MKNNLLVVTAIVCTICLWAVEGDGPSHPLKERTYNQWEKVKAIQAQYTKIFNLQVTFKEQWKRIDDNAAFAYTLMKGGNYRNALKQLEKIEKDLYALADKRGKQPSPGETKIPSKGIEPCKEDKTNSYQANRARYTGRIPRALRLFYAVARSTCLGKDDKRVIEAGNFIKERKNKVKNKIEKLKYENLSTAKRDDLRRSIREELAVFNQHDRNWVNRLKEAHKTVFIEMMEKTGEISGPPDQIKAGKKREPVKPVEYKVVSARTPPGEPGELYPLSLDIWQSAWGKDFKESGIKPLIHYLKKNKIKKINLNPGLPMGPKFYEEGLKKMQPLVKAFYAAGIEKINFLYAELNYPIEYYAKFLHDHPALGIDTIVDDSEFVDIFKDRFRENLMQVKKWGIKYSAFVTLESLGNSGVSDNSRFWVLDNVDQPILMSYFGCTLAEQKEKLEKYLKYADRAGKRGTVGIAILFGSKRVGREVSCEKLLNERQMQRFLFHLHRWAKQNHPSYGGIVIETNLRMPRVNIYPGQMD